MPRPFQLCFPVRPTWLRWRHAKGEGQTKVMPVTNSVSPRSYQNGSLLWQSSLQYSWLEYSSEFSIQILFQCTQQVMNSTGRSSISRYRKGQCNVGVRGACEQTQLILKPLRLLEQRKYLEIWGQGVHDQLKCHKGNSMSYSLMKKSVYKCI